MNTPTEYKRQLEIGRITSQLIGDVLFSLSKRSKNAADKERQYSSSKPEYSLQNREKKREYWGMLKKILTSGGFYPKEVYYVDRYFESTFVCREACGTYKDYLKALQLAQDPLFCESPCTSLCPDRHVMKKYLRTDFYLHYRVGAHSFVTLSSEKECDGYSHLPWTKLDNMYFDGADIKDLLPLPFCRKVYECFLATNENIF